MFLRVALARIPRKMTKRWTVSAVSKAALLLVLAIIGGAQAAEPCTFPDEIIDMGHPLHRTARPISTGGPLTIVALGSSSTVSKAKTG